MVPTAGDVEDGVEVGRLSGGQEHGRGAPLQGADLGRHHVVGGVLQAGVEVAAGLQVEQLAHLLAGLIAEGGGLDDGDVPGLPVAGAVARVEAVGGDLIIGHGNSFFLNGPAERKPAPGIFDMKNGSVLFPVCQAVPEKTVRRGRPLRTKFYLW